MERVRQFGLYAPRTGRHFVTRQHPVGPLADIGPAANRRDPPLQRIDVPGHIVEFADPRGDIIRPQIAFAKILPQPRDEARMDIGPALAEVGQRAGFPEPPHHSGAAHIGGHGFLGQALERGEIDRLRCEPQRGISGRGLEIGDQCGERRETRLGLAPVQMRERRETMLLDRVDLFLGELGRSPMLGRTRQRTEGPVTLVAARTPGDLRHLGWQQAAQPHAVELAQPGEGDMVHIEIEPHPDGVGGDDVIDLAILEQCDLLVARFGAQCAHHHRRAAAEPPQHLGHGVNLLRAEGDDGAARRQPRQLARSDMRERGKARAIGNLGFGDQLPHQRLERGRAQQHGFLAAARVEQPVGEDMAALAVGTDLRFVQGHERGPRTVARHGFGGAAHIACALGLDAFLARNQRDCRIAFDRAHPVVDLAREQPQRKAHASARMRNHALDRQMRLAGIGGPEDRLDRAILHAP